MLSNPVNRQFQETAQKPEVPKLNITKELPELEKGMEVQAVINKGTKRKKKIEKTKTDHNQGSTSIST